MAEGASGAGPDAGQAPDDGAQQHIVRLSFANRSVSILIRQAQDHIQRQIVRRKRFYELDLLTFLFHTTMPGAVVVDAGANIGNHTLFCACVLGARVIAFEPNPVLAQHLREHLVLNSCEANVEVHEAGLWSAAGRADLIQPNPRNSGMGQVRASDNGEVRLMTLDSLELARLDLLKIDVEGAELEVIGGGSDTIRRCRPLIVVECATAESFGAVSEMLRPFRYEPVLRFCVTPTYVFAHARSLDEGEPGRMGLLQGAAVAGTGGNGRI